MLKLATEAERLNYRQSQAQAIVLPGISLLMFIVDFHIGINETDARNSPQEGQYYTDL